MSIARTATVALIALGLGVALGLVLGGGGGAVESGTSDVDVRPAPETPPERIPGAEPDSTPTRTAREHVETAVEVSDLVDRAVASIEVPEVPTGDGRIDGRLTTSGGQPLAGIEVTAAMASDHRPGGRAWNELPIAEQVTWLVRGHRLAEASLRRTTTDADGRYLFENLPRVPHRVVGSSEQYRITYAGGYRLHVEPDATVDMSAEAIVKVSLALTLADGSEPAEARVVFTATTGGLWGVRWTPTNRVFDVQPGTHSVAATTGERKELTASVPSVTLTFGETPDEIALQLLSRPGIAGRLVLPPGAPKVHVAVGAELVAADATPESVAAGRSKAYADQWEDYRFSIPELLPGRYLLVAWDTQLGGILASQEVEVGDAMAIVDLVPDRPEREDYLEVVARGPDGAAVTGFHAGLRFEGAKRSGSPFQRTQRVFAASPPKIPRPDGSIWVRHIAASRVSGEGTYTALISHRGYGRVEREYRPGPAARVEVDFVEPAFIDVSVAGATPAMLLAGLSVAVSGRPSRSVGTDGHVRIGPNQPGEVKLVVWIRSGRNAIQIAEQSVHARAGESTATLPIPALHTLRVEWADASAGRGQSVRVRRKESPTFTLQRTASETGKFVLRFLPRGTYEVRAGGNRKEITLPGTDVVRF